MNSIFIKQLLIAVLFFGGSVMYFKSRYYIAIDTQKEPCLFARVFLVDRWDQDFKRGDLMVFDFKFDSPYLKNGDDVVKIVGGMPGETVGYDSQKVTIDGKVIIKSDIRKGMESLGVKFKENSKLVLQNSEYFLVGQRPLSFDSRYWGAVNKTQIIGKAYALY